MSRINIFHINPFTAVHVHVVVTFDYVDKSYRDRNVSPTRHGYRSRANGAKIAVLLSERLNPIEIGAARRSFATLQKPR